MKATRRQALIAAAAMPAAASVPMVARASTTTLIYDPQLVTSAPAGGTAISGDPIRFARSVFTSRPALVVGISRRADALLIADVGRESGYRETAAPAAFGPHAWALALRL